jgi:signal transduction histidine kinase
MSLLQYLSQRLLLLGLVVSAGIFYIVYILYQWGLDDSTEYYLTQDMQWATEMLANNQALPSNTQFRQFYLTITDVTDSDLAGASLNNSDTQSLIPEYLPGNLPEKYSSLLITKEKIEFFYLEDEIAFQYGLHQVLANGRSLTVVHQFSTEGAAAGFSLLEISISSSLVLIVIMLLGALFIYQRIARSMQHLLTAAQLTERPIVNENYAVADKEFIDKEFIEIDNIAVTLRNALEDLEAKNEQERLFIQTLSHELRTPMATVQVVLELLAKKELADNVREKLEMIFNSNQQMQQLSNDLLSLWSSSEERNVSEHREVLNLEEELGQVIDELDKAFNCKSRFIINSQHNNCGVVNVLASKTHFRLLLNNLCKNSIVHSNSQIYISAGEQKIIITNDKNQAEIDPLVAGAGIGLIIATRAAELLGWKIKIIETDSTYELRLLLSEQGDF